MARLWRSFFFGMLVLSVSAANGQDFDITEFVVTDEGPWSDIEATTVTVPQVLDGTITLDGKPNDAEYGGFAGVYVTPGMPNGDPGNAWILDFPGDREWDNPEDSSFTFWLAHDTEYLYVGVDVKDDVVNSDDINNAFWKDDALEIVTDAFNDNYDNNTDNSEDSHGGHAYFNYEGRFSGWDDDADALGEGAGRWSTEVDYAYGEGGEIFGFGEATDTGWNMELKMAKSLFESEEVGNKLVEGERMGFNLILDDDDQAGPEREDGNGEGFREQDLEIQYAWANRLRASGFNADEASSYSEEELANEEYLKDGFYDLVIDGNGRLSHGGAGEIIFGGLSDVVVTCDPNSMGDIDGSGDVAFADFLILSQNFGQAAADHTVGDIDCSGDVAFADFLILSQNFGQTVGGAQSVPEPTGELLLILAAMLCGATRRRR